jgi:hypothetical protein
MRRPGEFVSAVMDMYVNGVSTRKVRGALKAVAACSRPIPSNPIFDGVRCKSGRVKNWKSGKTQISRWAAASLLAGESRLRRIRGIKEIPIVLANLKSGLRSEARIA